MENKRVEVLQYKNAVLKQLKEQQSNLLAIAAKEKKAPAVQASGAGLAPVRPVQSSQGGALARSPQHESRPPQIQTANSRQILASQAPKVGTVAAAASTSAIPQKATAVDTVQYSTAGVGGVAGAHIGGSLGGIAAQGTGPQQHAVTRRSAVRLEADAAAAAASTGGGGVPPLHVPDQRTQNEIEREKLLNKLSLRESRLLLGLQTTAPLLQRSRTHWDYLLEEVQWLALDFRQEHRWKMSLSNSLARMCEEKVAKHDLKPVAEVRKGPGADQAMDVEGQGLGVSGSAAAKQGGEVEAEEERKKVAKAVAAQISAYWASFCGPRAEYFPERTPEEDAALAEEVAQNQNTAASATFFDAPTLMGVSDSSNAFTTRKQLQRAVAAAAINSVTPVVSNMPEPPPVLVGAAYGLNVTVTSGTSAYKFDFFTETASKFSSVVMKAVNEDSENQSRTNKQLVSSEKLLPHQVDVGTKVLAMCNNSNVPAGALLYGKVSVGKTAISVAVAATWLLDPIPIPKAATGTAGATGTSEDRRPQVVIVVPIRSMLRWLSELKRMCPNETVEIFGMSGKNEEDGVPTSKSSKNASFLLCAVEQLGDLLYDPTGPFYTGGVSKAPKAEKSEGVPGATRPSAAAGTNESSAAAGDAQAGTTSSVSPASGEGSSESEKSPPISPLSHVVGVVLDDRNVNMEALHVSLEDWRLRHIRDLSLRGDITPHQAKAMAMDAVAKTRTKDIVVDPVGILADHINARVGCRRCVVSQAMPPKARLGAFLAFVAPATSMLPLSTSSTVKNLRDAASLMTFQHWTRWCDQCQVVTGKGMPASIKVYPAATLLSTSFLVHLTPGDERLVNAQTREEIFTVDLGKGAQEDKYSMLCEYLASTGGFTGSANDFCMSQLTHGITALRDVCFNHTFLSLQLKEKDDIGASAVISATIKAEPGPTDGSTISPDIAESARDEQSCDGILRGPFFSSVADESALQGSCKLDSIKEILTRFSELRMIIVVENDAHRAVLHKYLEACAVPHMIPGLNVDRVMSTGGDSKCSDDDIQWLSAQCELYDLSKEDASTCVVLVTSDMMASQAVLPSEVDVLIVLSERYDDIKSARDICRRFQLRLLAAGQTGDPVTIVRVVAKGTIEETLVRKRQSLTQCSGLSLKELLGSAAFREKDTLDTGALTSAPAGVRNAQRDPARDFIDKAIAAKLATYEGDSTNQSKACTKAITQVLVEYLYAPNHGSTNTDHHTNRWMQLYRQHAHWVNLSRYRDDLPPSTFMPSPYTPVFASLVIKRLYNDFGGVNISSVKKGAPKAKEVGGGSKKPVKTPVLFHMANTISNDLAYRKREFLENLGMSIVVVERFEANPDAKAAQSSQGAKSEMSGGGSVGATAGERDFWRLVTPHGCHPDALTIGPQYGISSSCTLAFRAALREHRRLGQEMDSHLYVNPIQNASRSDTVVIPSWQASSHEVDGKVAITYRDRSNTTQGLRVRSPRASENKDRHKRTLDVGPMSSAGLQFKKSRLEVEGLTKDGGSGTAPVPLAGTLGPYCFRPHVMTVTNPGHKTEIEIAKHTQWRQHEDDIICCVQALFPDPTFALTAYAVNKVPENAGPLSSVSGRSIKRVKDRFEALAGCGRYFDHVRGHLAPRIAAIRESLKTSSGEKESHKDQLNRVWTALDYVYMEPETERATTAQIVKERSSAIIHCMHQLEVPRERTQVPQQQAQQPPPQRHLRHGSAPEPMAARAQMVPNVSIHSTLPPLPPLSGSSVATSKDPGGLVSSPATPPRVRVQAMDPLSIALKKK